MFYLSIIGTRNGSNDISVSQNVSLHAIRDGTKKFKELHPILIGKKNKVELYLIYTLLQFCSDNLLDYDIKRAEIYGLNN
jgi:hypothetical protein